MNLKVYWIAHPLLLSLSRSVKDEQYTQVTGLTMNTNAKGETLYYKKGLKNRKVVCGIKNCVRSKEGKEVLWWSRMLIKHSFQRRPH